jgi:hypothetical protein
MKGGSGKTAKEKEYEIKLDKVIDDINKIKSDFYESFFFNEYDKKLINIKFYNQMVDSIDSKLDNYIQPIDELIAFLLNNYKDIKDVELKRARIDRLKIKCRNKIMDFLDEALNDNINMLLLNKISDIRHGIEEYKSNLTNIINSVSKDNLDATDKSSVETNKNLKLKIREIINDYKSIYPDGDITESEQIKEQFEFYSRVVDELFDELFEVHLSIRALIDKKRASYVNSNKVKSRKRLKLKYVNKTRKRN